jgi:NAD(P)-dependent dehydrogenase (short-subunit alcohol dehydrogenase family)
MLRMAALPTAWIVCWSACDAGGDVKHFTGRVAVVTGAASGIGRALAGRFAAEGMKVVLADIEPGALAAAAEELERAGAEVLAVPTDVSRAEEVAALARRTQDAFGAVHVVCNNAGVFTGGLLWEAPLADYEWVLGVNLWGVIHGIRSFTPLLLAHGEEGHIVNTASMAALTTLPYAGIYHMSKHAVLALSESLHHELALRGSKIKVSALCPEMVATRIGSGARNRPAHLRGPADAGPASPERELVEKALAESITRGVAPERIADRVLAAIREERFYVLSDEEWRRCSQVRIEDLRLGRNPTLAPPGSA